MSSTTEAQGRPTPAVPVHAPPSALARLWNRFTAVIFGDDVFVAYSRADGTDYAVELTERLRALGYSVVIDRWASRRGRTTPYVLRRALRRCSMLVVVGTKAAGQSPEVRLELDEFGTSRPMAVTILDLEEPAAAWPQLDKANLIASDARDLPARVPSDEAIKEIVDRASFTRQGLRLQRIAFATVAALLLIIAGASLTTRWLAAEAASEQERAERAVAEREDAETETRRAEARSAAAKREREAAMRRLGVANATQQKAEKERKYAMSDRDRADRIRAYAERLRDQAQAERDEANRNKLLARAAAAEAEAYATQATKGANDATERERGAKIAEKRATESLLVASANTLRYSFDEANNVTRGVRTVIGELVRRHDPDAPVPRVLNHALAETLIAARRSGVNLGVGGYPHVEDFDLAPGRDLLLSVSERPRESGVASYWAELHDLRNPDVRRVLETSSEKMTRCALSPDGRRASIGYDDGRVVIHDLEEGTKEQIFAGGSRTEGSPFALTFDASGRNLVVGSNRRLFLVSPGSKRSLKTTAFEIGGGRPLNLPYRSIAEIRINAPRPKRIAIFQSEDQSLQLIDVSSGKLTHHALPARTKRRAGLITSSMAVDPNGRWWAFVGERDGRPGRGYVVDLQCERPRRDRCERLIELPWIFEPDSRGEQLRFHPDGRRLLVQPTASVLHAVELESFRKGDESFVTLRRPEPFRVLQVTAKTVVLGSEYRLEIAAIPGSHDAEESRSFSVPGVSFHQYLEILFDESSERVAIGDMSALRVAELEATPGLRFDAGSLAGGERLPAAQNVVVSPDGRLLASLHKGHGVALWSIARRRILGVFKASEATALAWAGDAQPDRLYMGDGSGQLYAVDEFGRAESLDAPKKLGRIERLEYLGEGDLLVVHTAAGGVWRRRGRSWEKIVDGSTGPVAISPDGRSMAVVGPATAGESTKSVEVRDLGGDSIRELKVPEDLIGRLEHIDFKLGGRRVVATAKVFGRTIVWDAEDGELVELSQVSRDDPFITRPNTDAYWLSPERKLFDLERGTWIQLSYPSALMEGLGDSCVRTAVHAQTGLVAMSCGGHVAVIDGRTTKTQTVAVVRATQARSAVAFTPDGKMLAYIAADGRPELLPLRWGAQAKALCLVVPDGFNEADMLNNQAALAFCHGTSERRMSLEPTAFASPWTRTLPP